MAKTQVTNAVKAAIDNLNNFDGDYCPGDISNLTGLPLNVVLPLIKKAGWCEKGHQYSSFGFYEMA